MPDPYMGVRTLNNDSPATKAAGLGTRLLSIINNVRHWHNTANSVCVTSPGLAIGSADKKKVKIVNKFLFFAAGAVKTKASAEVAFTATTHDIAADAGAAQERWYLFTIVADGTVTITAGTAGAVGSGTFPATPAGGIPIGALRLEIAAGATIFDATTDELDEAHITDEYYDFIGGKNPLDLPTIPTTLPGG